LLRKSVIIEKQVKSAVAFVTGLGYFEFYVNGQKAGNDVLVSKYYKLWKSWNKLGKQHEIFSMQIIVPVGCEATVYIPKMRDNLLLESGNPVSQSTEIQILDDENEFKVMKVKSGHYQFTSK